MKKPEDKLATLVEVYITNPQITEKVGNLKNLLDAYLKHKCLDNDIPSRRDVRHHEKVMKLEQNPETWQEAQEIWNTSWILDEVRNIESSLEQIETCLKEKQKLELERLV
jgi:hypothetical protein